MKLSEWMKAEGLSDEAVAALVGAERATISRIRRQRNRPSWELAARIKKASQGAVTADDYLPDRVRMPRCGAPAG